MTPLDVVSCLDCNGTGQGPDGTEYSLECCGDDLPSGECCAALYGTARLVPVPYPVPMPCPTCGGYGELPVERSPDR